MLAKHMRPGPGSTVSVISIVMLLVNTQEFIRVAQGSGRKERKGSWEGRMGGWKCTGYNLGRGCGQAEGMLRNTPRGDGRGGQPDGIALVEKAEKLPFLVVFVVFKSPIFGTHTM